METGGFLQAQGIKSSKQESLSPNKVEGKVSLKFHMHGIAYTHTHTRENKKIAVTRKMKKTFTLSKGGLSL